MSTSLWFSEKDREVNRLKNLVACGQFTACYKLLNYCYEIDKNNVNVDKTLLKTMKSNLETDWKKFIENPYWLHDKEIAKF